MGKTQEEMEPKNKRGQGRCLHQIPELQIRKCQAEANGLVGILGEKRTELSNTGHTMDDETFITHLLNSLQSEYEGAILSTKDKLRKGEVDLPEIEQILEDKYRSMKHVKGYDEEEDDYALFTIQSNKKSPRRYLRDIVDTVGNLDTKQLIVSIRKAIRIRVLRDTLNRKRNTVLKESTREKDIWICPKLNATIEENMGIIHMTVQNQVIMLILLNKVSETRNSRI